MPIIMPIHHNQQTINNFRVYLILQQKRGNNALEIRTLTSNPEVMKIIIEAALSQKPIFIFPTFRDKLRAISSLMERKIIKYNHEKNEYKFLI